MPILTTPVTELTHHVLENISRQILDRFIHQMGLMGTIGDNIYINTKYSSISDTTDGELNARLRTNRIIADVTLQVNPNSVKWGEVLTFSHSPSYGVGAFLTRNTPIFNDRQFGIALYEQAAPCSIQMNCTLHITEKSLAYALPLKFFNKFQDSSVMQMHDLIYDYKLTNEMIYVLGQIYTHKRYSKAFETFYHYLRYWSKELVSQSRSTLTGDREELVVKKHNVECLSMLEYSEEEPNTDNTESSVNSFTLNFMITTQFNMVNSLILSYPIMIENKLLPIEAIPLPVPLRDRCTGAGMDDINMNEYFKQHRYLHHDYIQVPFYDDWILPPTSRQRSASHNPILIAACSFDEDHPSTIIDMTCNLGEDYILPMQLRQILSRQEEICPGGSFDSDGIISIGMYLNEKQLNRDELYLSPELEFEYYSRNITAMHHLVISETTDIAQLSPKYYPVLLEYLEYFDLQIVRQLWWLADKGVLRIEILYSSIDGSIWIERNKFISQYRSILAGAGKTSSRRPYRDPATGQIKYHTVRGAQSHITGVDTVRFIDMNTNKSVTVQVGELLLELINNGGKHGNRVNARIFKADLRPVKRVKVRS